MRKETEEIYYQKANLVIDYISANLHHSLQLDKMANITGVSQRHLLRIMRIFLKEPLSSYITRQRLERALMYMHIEEMSLTELAEMVGYDSAQSFSKAFKKFFGISPKACINNQKDRLKTVFNSLEENYHSPEIAVLEETRLVYIRIFGKYGEKDPYTTAWHKLVTFLKTNNLLNMNTRFIGISFDDPNITASHLCRFYACASVKRIVVPTNEFGTITLRKGKYAIYTLKGSYSKLREFYNKIHINRHYELRHGVAFEEYVNTPQNTDENELITKVFIPIK